MAASSTYIRVKRQKQTVFLHVELTDTVKEVKAKIEALLEKPPSKQKLYKEDGVELEDRKSLAELKIETDDSLVLACQRDDGSWERADNVIGYDEGEEEMQDDE